MSEPTNPRRYFKTLLKLSVTALALWFVFSKIELRRVGQVLVQANPGWLLAAVVGFVFSKWLSAVRLNHFFAAISIRLAHRENVRLYWLGMFYNLFLPGGIGGDGYKIYLLQRRFGVKARTVFWAVLLDRVSGMVALVVLAAAFMTSVPAAAPYLSWGGAATALMLAVYYYVNRRWFPQFLPVFGITSWQALGVQVAQVFSALFILWSLGHFSQLSEYLLIFLLSSVVSVLPLTIGGVGAREMTFLLGSQLLHLDATLSITLSLIFYCISALTALPGAFVSADAHHQ